MEIIAVMTPKGGIGKTTTADSIAYILAKEHKKRVLLVDADPQGDTSKTYGVYNSETAGLRSLLESNGDCNVDEFIQNTGYENIDIISGNEYLVQTDMNLMCSDSDDQTTKFKTAMEELQDRYDYCICDCGKLFDMVVINILMAAGLIIAPFKLGGFETEALYNLEEQVMDLTEYNPKLKIKVLMTMRQKNKTSIMVEETLKQESEFDVFNTVIRRSITAEKSTCAMLPVPNYSKNGIVTQDYKGVVQELLKEINHK